MKKNQITNCHALNFIIAFSSPEIYVTVLFAKVDPRHSMVI